jgi:hypothetical protein
MVELLRTYTPKPIERSAPRKTSSSASERLFKIVLVGDRKFSAKTQVPFLALFLVHSIHNHNPKVLMAYAKSNPKMRQVDTQTEDNKEQSMYLEGEAEVEGRPLSVSLYDTPSSEQGRILCYPFADLILILFSVIEPDSLRNVLKKVSTSQDQRENNPTFIVHTVDTRNLPPLSWCSLYPCWDKCSPSG